MYKELIKHELQLKEVEVISIKMDKNIEFASTEKSIDLALVIKIEHDIIDDKRGYTVINVQVGDDTTPFKIEVTQRGLFETDEIVEHDIFSRFLEIQGLKILWSYVRQTIFDITAKTGHEPYMLPTLDVLATLEKNNRKG